MNSVENFIYKFDNEQRAILIYLNNLLTNEFNLISKIRYKIPFYYRKSWICYLNPIKNSSIEFVFIRGNELQDIPKILDSKGRKQVKGIAISDLKKIPIKKIMAVIHEAIILDDTIPYASKRKKLILKDKN